MGRSTATDEESKTKMPGGRPLKLTRRDTLKARLGTKFAYPCLIECFQSQARTLSALPSCAEIKLDASWASWLGTRCRPGTLSLHWSGHGAAPGLPLTIDLGSYCDRLNFQPATRYLDPIVPITSTYSCSQPRKAAKMAPGMSLYSVNAILILSTVWNPPLRLPL